MRKKKLIVLFFGTFLYKEVLRTCEAYVAQRNSKFLKLSLGMWFYWSKYVRYTYHWYPVDCISSVHFCLVQCHRVGCRACWNVVVERNVGEIWCWCHICKFRWWTLLGHVPEWLKDRWMGEMDLEEWQNFYWRAIISI